MAELFWILTPIGLIDSLSIFPVAIVPLVLALASDRPLWIASQFLLGLTGAYLLIGLLIFFGLEPLFDAANTYLYRLWQQPTTSELMFQVILGLWLCAYGLRVIDSKRREEAATEGLTPRRALILGALLTLVGMPGALPYFVAIDFAMRADAGPVAATLVLTYYNLLFVLPLVAIMLLRLCLGVRITPTLNAIKGYSDRWGQKAINWVLVILGVVLIVDGFGWFLGYPLIPV